jgi:hypothetical protein
MHSIPLVNNPTATKAIVYRSLLLLAAVAILFLGKPAYFWLNGLGIVALLAAALVIHPLLQKNIPGWLLLLFAGILAATLTSSWVLAILLPAMSSIALIFNKPAAAIIDAAGITIKHPPVKKHYPWAQLANAIIKDGLLTIDCQNNQLLQLETTLSPEKEKTINEYMAAALAKNFN